MVDLNTPSAQASLIGCLLMDSERSPTDQIAGEMLAKIKDEDFLDGDCKKLFIFCRDAFTEGKIITPQLIGQRAGAEYSKLLKKCINESSFPSTWKQDAEIIAEESRVSRIQSLSMRIVTSNNSDEQASICERILEICARRNEIKRISPKEDIDDFWEEQRRPTDYITTGIEPIDKQLSIARNNFVVIGGRPSAGKTALSLQMMAHISKTKRVIFFTLENSRQEIRARYYSQISGVPLKAIKNHCLKPLQEELIHSKESEIAKMKYDVIEASGWDVEQIRRTSLQYHAEVIFIDYLQLIQSRGQNRTEEVTKVSIGLANLARSCHITVFALSQLSRLEKGASPRPPALSDLRESGQIEQDANAIFLLSKMRESFGLKDKVTGSEISESDRYLDLAKNKDGEIGNIVLGFNGPIQQFYYFSKPPERIYPEYCQEEIEIPEEFWVREEYSGFSPKDDAAGRR